MIANRKILTLIAAFTLFATSVFGKKMEVTFCVDLSASTNGLIDYFNAQYWDILNHLETNESVDDFKIALVGYGRRAFKEKNNYTKVLSDLTDNPENIISELNQLPTYIESSNAELHTALKYALKSISWSKDDNISKTIIFIGNGSFFSNKIEKFNKDAKKEGIVLKAIYYKSEGNEAYVKAWKKAFEKIEVDFSEFTPSESKIVFDKNYDYDWMIGAGKRLNDTYLYYGENGAEMKKQLEDNDAAAQQIGEEAIESRIVFKASRLFQGKNYSWDLVDKYLNGSLIISEIDKSLLSPMLGSMNDEQLLKYIKLKAQQRDLLLKQIVFEKARRNAHLKRKNAKLKRFSGNLALGQIVIQWIDLEASQETAILQN